MSYPYPVLFRIGNISIFTFGVFMLVAFLLALWVALRRRGSLDEEHIYNLTIISLVAGMIGARIAYILFNLNEFASFYDYVAIWQGGMSFFGGFFLALIATYFYAKKKGLSYAQITDIFAPSLALGIAITRVGGFLSGANPGLPTELPWAIFDPATGTLTHPTALYHAIANFAIFFALLWLAKSQLREKFENGYLFAVFILLFGLERFINDFFRAYNSLATIVAARAVPLALIVLAGLFLLRLRKKA